VSYDGVESLDSSIPTSYVDFSGDTRLRERVHHAGLGAAQELIEALVAGRIDPKDGHVVVLT
jgi:hypothetical protein